MVGAGFRVAEYGLRAQICFAEKKMDYTTLGRTNLKVSVAGLGAAAEVNSVSIEANPATMQSLSFASHSTSA